MALRIDPKDKLTQWFIFCVLISGLGLYGHYVYIYQPKQEQIDQLTQQSARRTLGTALLAKQSQRRIRPTRP